MARWHIAEYNQAISWDVTPGDIHKDDLEMAGFFCADVVTYGMTKDGFLLKHHPVFPRLRLRPINTHATYQLDVEDRDMPRLIANGEPISEVLTRVTIDGVLSLETVDNAHSLSVTHLCYPSVHYYAAYEKVSVTNQGNAPVLLTASAESHPVAEALGARGRIAVEMTTDFTPLSLGVGETYTYYIAISGRTCENEKEIGNPEDELLARRKEVERLVSPMKLDTGNEVLDLLFRFSKIRAGESVFDTRFGLIHSPGGYSYYAATWCNDQVEYSGPWFAYTGDSTLLEAAMNAYRMYRPYMSDSYEPIPSSVISEGDDFWNGAGDRGDAAMYLYGASRFALASGSREYAKELLPAIEWCAEYCRRRTNEDGVILSDTDELEGRFPSGKANLCTSSLAYAGLLAASALESEFGKNELSHCYKERALKLRESIEKYFGATIHGIPSYQYYDGCDVLRSWICMPLCVGIFERAKATVDALCSDYLLRSDGLLTTEGNETVWDRQMLYALRGIFASGYSAKAVELLLHYTENRLLGERVPYAVEAYPEGGKRHLSAESALFCKIILEGLLDVTPTGLHSFTVKPNLPAALDHCYLTDIHAYGDVFDILVSKDGYRVVRSDGKLLAEGKPGETVTVTL